MVQPNPPRFFREGDELEFTVKVTNMSDTHQTGTVRLTFANARTGKSIDQFLGNFRRRTNHSISPRKNRTASPGGLRCPTCPAARSAYKAVGSTGRVSDGEEGLLPVLVRRTLVHEVAAAADPRPGDEDISISIAS